MHERFVIVHRTSDPIQAEMLGQLLRGGGVTARVVGTRSAATIGVGQNIVEIHISVPESEAGQATDFLEAYFAELAAEQAERGDEPQEEDEVPGERELRPVLAAGSAFLTFGLGHVYARRPYTAAALAAGQLVALYFLFGGHSWHEWATGMILFGAVVGCDMVGAVVAVRASRGGLRRGPAWQSAVGASYVVAALGLSLLVGPRMAPPQAARGGGHAHHGADQGDSLSQPLDHDSSFLPLTSQHPANPYARTH
jgi:hypothetical protein